MNALAHMVFVWCGSFTFLLFLFAVVLAFNKWIVRGALCTSDCGSLAHSGVLDASDLQDLQDMVASFEAASSASADAASADASESADASAADAADAADAVAKA
jgi:hypothetical protein